MFDPKLIHNCAQLSYQGPIGDEWLDGFYARYVPLSWGKLIGENLHDPKHEEPYYRFLYYLAQVRQPQVSLVLGVWMGIDCAHIAKGYPDGLVYGIDHQGHGGPLEVMRACPNFTYQLEDTVEWGAQCADLLRGKIGLIFWDSSHLYDDTVREWGTYRPLLDESAILVFDDVTPAFEIERFFREQEGEHLLFPGLHYGNCIGVILP